MNKSQLLDDLLDLAIKEDINEGDHSALSCIPKSATGKAQLIIKEAGTLAGMEIVQKVFARVDGDLQFDAKLKDGDQVSVGDIAFTISGSSISILSAERLALNCMQRMSGIATKTATYAHKIVNYNTQILDTRKTTPGLRLLEKMAVKIGGGTNHRFGLYDMIMIKDNHIDYAGGIKEAIDSANAYIKANNLDIEIEVEARNLEEVKTIMSVGSIKRIMLDNFDYETTQIAVDLIDGQFETESSGGITLETLEGYAKCGVDYISVGAITHSAVGLDMSLKAM